MARVFRQRYTKPLPAGSKVKRNRVQIAGKWLAVNAAKTRYRIESKTWFMEYRDSDNVKRIETTRCKDLQAARGVLQETLKRVELIRAGVLTNQTAVAATHAGASLHSHLTAWQAALLAGGRSKAYRHNCQVYLARLQRECRVSRLVDLTYEVFDEWIRNQGPRRKVEGKKVGLSARSRNAYRETLVAFCSWCVQTGRLTSNPFLSYPVANTEADPQRPRRAFTDDELRRLIDATEKRSPARALAYRVMALTGLRVSEVRSLRVGDFKGATLRLAAKNAKNRTAAEIPLRSDLVRLLVEWCRGAADEEPLIRVPAPLTRRFDGDLRAAGITKVDAKGRSLDVHSLRHTFATALVRAGVVPRVAQQLMRHSTIHLTMKVYTDPSLLDGEGAIEALQILL